MQRILWSGTTGTLSQMQRLDNLSNNIANANTNSFKSSKLVFSDLVSQNIADSGKPTDVDTLKTYSGSGAKVAKVYNDFSQGVLTKSDNPLSIAIKGKGFFKVVNSEGNDFYTRDGNFTTDTEGRLANLSGHIIPDIKFGEDTQEVKIHPNGTVQLIDINGNVADAGQIRLYSFDSPQGLEPVGDNLFKAGLESGNPNEQAPGQNGVGVLKQGYVELSNTNITEEMVTLMNTQRSIQLNAQTIKTADQLWEMANNLRR